MNAAQWCLDPDLQNQLRILPVGLLFAHSLAADLRCIAHPQLELQFSEQSFQPARMSTGFHSDSHRCASSSQLAVELLCLFRVLQTSFPQFSCVGIYRCDC
jgi:hypothetical protein